MRTQFVIPVLVSILMLGSLGMTFEADAAKNNKIPKGTVECGQTITESIKLTSDVGPCPIDGIVIGADNITLDCGGKTITGSDAGFGGFGISSLFIDGTTIKNCKVTGFVFGTFLLHSSNSILEKNKAEDNLVGFRFVNAHYTEVKKNTAIDNENQGFHFDDSNYNTFTKNKSEGNSDGFRFDGSIKNTITKNNAKNNDSRGFLLLRSDENMLDKNKSENSLLGFQVSESVDNIFEKNQAKNNSIHGFIDFTTGSGTSGTANTYDLNKCKDNTFAASIPEGLCKSK